MKHFQFRFGLKDQLKPRQQLTDAEIETAARPGETLELALQRKRELADVKWKLR